MQGSTAANRFRRLVVPVALIAVAALAALPTAQAATNTKTYTANLTSSVGAGSLTTFTFTIKNTANPQLMGSVNLTVNSAFVVTAGTATSSPGTASTAGNVIKIRSLGLTPGSTATVTFQAEATCVAGSYASSIVVKQSNDFNGNPGNNFVQTPGNLDPGVVTTSVTGTCKLHFLSSPAPANLQVGDTQVTSQLSDAPASSGGPVRVEVLDASSSHRVVAAFGSASPVTMSIGTDPSSSGTAVLSGTLTRSASAGVASFGNLSIDKPGIGYTLHAEGKNAGGTPDPGIDSTGATSDAFNIDSFIFFCNQPNCGKHSASTNDNTITSQLDPTNDLTQGTILALALNVQTIDCAGYDELTSSVTLQYTGSGTKLATDTIPAATAGNRSASQFETCFSSDTPFTPKDGGPKVTLGLLPDCDKLATNPPCAFPGKKDPATGNIVIKYLLPEGDPVGRH